MRRRRFHGVRGFFCDLRFGLRMLLAQSRIFHPGDSLFDFRNRRQCRSFQLDRRNLVPPLSGGSSPGAPIRAHRNGTRRSGPNCRFPGQIFSICRGAARYVDSFLVSKITGTTLSIGDRAEVTTGSIVSANYFDAIGVHPILGRGFEPGEDSGSNAHPVTVISYQLWQGRFKGDPQIIGKTQRLDGVPHTIVGVAPEGFYGTFVGWAMQFWVPASMEEIFEGGGYKLEDRGARWIEAYARLKPGVTREQAQQEIAAVAKRLEKDYPDTNRGRSIKLWPLWQTPFNNADTLLPTLEIMLAVVIFVLLIACANVGNLLLVRSFARRHEMTVRMAIGAGRGRLVRQLVTEGLILAAFGAAGGLLMAYWCRHVLVLLLPARGGVAMHLPGEIDWRVLALSAGVCLIATLLLGLVPAMQTRDLDLSGALKAESAGVVGRGRRGMGSLGPCSDASVIEFRFAGRSGAPAAEPAEDKKYQPGFFDARGAGNDRQSGAGRIRCAARPEFPGPTPRSRKGNTRRRVGGVRAHDAAELCEAIHPRQSRWMAINPRLRSSPSWSTTKSVRTISRR